jgi:tetratricopeptide (TPR) repeat protein
MARTLLHLFIFCAVPGVALPAGAKDPAAGEEALRGGRHLVTQFHFNEALDSFRAAERGGADQREARFGQALALLNTQPQTARNIAQATQLLDALIADPGDGKLEVAARYFRARIAHHHQSPVNLADAAERYAALYRDHPQNRLGQQAMVKLAILRLYDPAGQTSRAEIVAELGRLASEFPDAVARRDLHLVLGNAVLFFDLPGELALGHLIAAMDAGIQGYTSRGNVLVAMGEIARELGRNELAAQYYREFLKLHRRDNRAFTVSQRLAGLEVGATTPGEMQRP